MSKKETVEEVPPVEEPSIRPLIEVVWRRLRDEEVGKEPDKTHMSDVGYDLTCSRYIQVSPNSRVQIPTNIALAIPDGMFGLVLPRSSTFHKRGLIGHIGVIDPGYRGEVMFVVYNPTRNTVHVGDGERLAQILFLPVCDVNFQEVRKASQFPKGERGEKGFGSTGGFQGPGQEDPAK
jgi:dUTP pyrophosphatase